MGRTEFPQRTSWDKLNSPRTTSCARLGIGKIVMKAMIKSTKTIMKLPRTRFTLGLLEFISVGDSMVCSRVLNRVNLAPGRTSQFVKVHDQIEKKLHRYSLRRVPESPIDKIYPRYSKCLESQPGVPRPHSCPRITGPGM